MNAPLVISTFFLLALTSCNSPSAENRPQQETPKALEDKSFSYEAISKRGYDDLLESLYKELAEKTPELKELDTRIEKTYQDKVDSIKIFDKYSAKNEAFYSSAHTHATQIKDSLLRQRMKIMIANSLKDYKSSIAQHEEILSSIKTKDMELDDLYAALKIIKTLPMIDKYQKDNLPTTKSLKGLYKQLDETTKYANTLVKK